MIVEKQNSETLISFTNKEKGKTFSLEKELGQNTKQANGLSKDGEA